jgi:peptidoglycan/xylan/chitin deacetylase (PgdA/CDA1 family)
MIPIRAFSIANAAVSVAPLKWIVERLASRYPRVLFLGPGDRRQIALTIDDCPDPATTPQILEVLRRYDARATFFIITEQVSGAEALLDQIVAEGHELGNHLTRDESSISLTPNEFERELDRSHEVLLRYAHRLSWFRPGGGRFNDSMLDAVEAHGYRCALGSLYPFDAHIPSSRFASWVLTRGAGAGTVAVLHDRGARGARTVTTLSHVLPRWKASSFEVVTLSQLVRASDEVDR